MEKVIEVLNRMQADGVIERFAIGGGIATIYYLEPYQTDEIDVFFLPVGLGDSGLVTLEPTSLYLANLGYYRVRDVILIENWPVQLVAAFKALQLEAVRL